MEDSDSSLDSAEGSGVSKKLSLQYEGFVLRPNDVMERIKPNISAKAFFQKYVCPRRPVVFNGSLEDPEWKGREWSNEYLKKVAGDCPVQIEQRGKNQISFGTGVMPKLRMTFGEFIDRVQNNELLYLTTQYEEEDGPDDEDGKPASDNPVQKLTDVIPPPCSEMLNEFPLRPRLLGNLLLQQVNIWMGNSKNGTSSGLHHDYHDNLYVLLRGKKRFTIYAPSDAPYMYTYGEVEQQWPNGLITYKGRPTRADGAGGADLLEYTVRRAAADLEELKANPRASAQDIGRAQQAYNRALAECNRALNADGNDSDDEDENEDSEGGLGGLAPFPGGDGDGSSSFDEMDFDNLKDDFDEAEYVDAKDTFDDDDDEDEEDEDEQADSSRKRKRDSSASSSSGKLRPASKKPKGSSSPRDKQSESESKSQQPPSFSKIDVETLQNPTELARKFPLFEKTTPMVIEIKAGEMLWLPAGWFHEVVSFSDPDQPEQGHVAFNYWMHPPTSANFEHPYPDNYWKEKFEMLQQWVNDKKHPPAAGTSENQPQKAAKQKQPPRPFDDFFEMSDDDDTPAKRRAALKRNPKVVPVNKAFKPTTGSISAIAEAGQQKLERKLPLKAGWRNNKRRK